MNIKKLNIISVSEIMGLYLNWINIIDKKTLDKIKFFAFKFFAPIIKSVLIQVNRYSSAHPDRWYKIGISN